RRPSSAADPCPSRSLVQHSLAMAARAHLAPVRQQLVADAGALAALAAHDHHVAGVDGGLALGDAALDVALGVGPRVLLDEADPLHDDPVLLRDHLQDLALLAGVPARDHRDRVVLLEVDAGALPRGGDGHGYRTSGASEMIFMNFLSRSSR